jgi:hypothetical protein
MSEKKIYKMCVRSEYETKQKTDEFKNIKPSLRNFFLNKKFERSHNRGVIQAWELSCVVEGLINCKIFSNFNFQVTFPLPVRTDRKVFW